MKKYLFNPFEKYSEKRLLLIGFLASVVGILVAYWFQGRYDGVLDVHFATVSLTQSLVDFAVNVLSLLLLFYLVALIINRKTRLVDLLSAILISRIPIYVLPLANAGGFMYRTGLEIQQEMATTGNWTPDVMDVVIMIVFVLFTLLLLVWSMALLYNGFRVATNAKGGLHIVLFIAAILLAEIISKIALYQLDPFFI